MPYTQLALKPVQLSCNLQKHDHKLQPPVTRVKSTPLTEPQQENLHFNGPPVSTKWDGMLWF